MKGGGTIADQGAHQISIKIKIRRRRKRKRKKRKKKGKRGKLNLLRIRNLMKLKNSWSN